MFCKLYENIDLHVIIALSTLKAHEYHACVYIVVVGL